MQHNDFLKNEEAGGVGGGTRLPILSTFVGLALLPVNYSEDSEYIHLL